MPVKQISNVGFGLKIFDMARFDDDRGYFQELYKKSAFKDVPPIVQVNYSHSKKNVLRGMHFQWDPHMGKLVTCLKGEILDVVFDLRLGSPNYACPFAIKLYEIRPKAFWIPSGFAHGFYAYEDSIVMYGCTGEYNGKCEASIKFDDKKINFDWSAFSIDTNDIIISDKDRDAMPFEQWNKNLFHEKFAYKE